VSTETGIYIRARVDGRWQTVDIADPRLSNADLLAWLRDDPSRRTAERVVLLLLGRDQSAVEVGPAGETPERETSEQARRRVLSQAACCEDAAAFDDPELIAHAREELGRDLDAYAASVRAGAVRPLVELLGERLRIAEKIEAEVERGERPGSLESRKAITATWRQAYAHALSLPFAVIAT
jgi:hypothetical protein